MAFQKLKNTFLLGHDYRVKPAGLQWRSNTFFITSTVAVGLFTDLFLYGLVVPILPYILEDRVGIPSNEVQGHVSGLLAAYAGASVIFSPIAGIIADKTSSRQLPFLSGLIALLMATILLFLGQNEVTLAIARVLQGISAAVVWTIGLAICLDTVGPENLGKTIGSIFSFISVGSLAAPVLGGVLYASAGYAGVFGIGSGILAIDFCMRLLVIEKGTAAKYNGSQVGAEENARSTEHDNDDEENGDNEEAPLLGKKEKDYYCVPPNQPSWLRKVPILYCFKDPSLLTAFLMALIQATVLSTFDATVPIQGQQLFGYDSLHSGLLFIPLGIVDLFVGPIAGWTVDRYGTRPAATFGYALFVPVLVSLRAVHTGGKDQIILYCGLLALCGVSLAIVSAPSIVEAGAVVQRYHKANPDFFGPNGPYAQLYGINSMVFSAGLTLGPLIAGGLKGAIGYGNMNAILGVVCGITSVLCFVYIGRR